MSAFLCSNDHINAIVTALYNYIDYPPRVPDQWGEIPTVDTKAPKTLTYREGITTSTLDPRQIGCILMAENVRSLKTRYDSPHIKEEGDWNAWDKELGTYAYRATSTVQVPHHKPGGLCTYKKVTVTPIVAIKLIDSYLYQTCESDDHEKTVAWQLAKAIREKLIDKIPGYNEAPWSV